MFLRKKVAELAQLSLDEMHGVLKLPNLNKAPAQARPKQTRTTVSLHKQYCLMLLMQPNLAKVEDLQWIHGDSDEEQMLRLAIETCLLHPHSKPVVIMRELEDKVDSKMLRELQRDLSMLDETLDFVSGFNGARQQLRLAYTQKQENALLAQISEKPLSALTESERALLKNLGNKPSQNRV
jgi:DNA primase